MMDEHQADPVEQAGWSGVDHPVNSGENLSSPAGAKAEMNDGSQQSNGAEGAIDHAGDEGTVGQASTETKAPSSDESSTDTVSKHQPSATNTSAKKQQCPMVVTTPSGMRIDVPTGARLDLQDGYLVELAPGVPFSFKRHFFGGGVNVKIVFGEAPSDPAVDGDSGQRQKSQEEQFWTFTDTRGARYTIPMGHRLEFGLFNKGGSILGPPGSVFTLGDAAEFDRRREEAARRKAGDEAKEAKKSAAAAGDGRSDQGGFKIKDRLKGVLGIFQSSERKDSEKAISGYDSETTLS